VSDEKRKPILVYLTDSERAQLEAKAEANSRSLSGEGRAAIRAWIAPARLGLHPSAR
jgi:hypothetical protein